MTSKRNAAVQSAERGRKIRAKGTGSPTWRNAHWWVRVSLPDGSRLRYKLCRLDDACTCATMSEAMRLERCSAVSERKRADVQRELAALEKADRERRLTVQQFGEAWTDGTLYERFGDINGLKVKKSAKTDAHRLKAYVYPEIGAKAVADVTEHDIEHVMREAEKKAKQKLGRPWRKASRFQLYQVLRRLFDLAIRPGRLRADSPVSDYLRPGHDDPKLFGFLYPSELLALLACSKVPLERRVLYALAVYTGLRKGSLYALTWPGVDFTHGTLTSLSSKTGLPQLFEIPEALVNLLAAWHAHRRQPKSGAVVRPTVPTDREAESLRDDLELAGVERWTDAARSPNVEPLRFHDLRATFVTWAMREGRGDGWISDRTGHLTPEMRSRYARAARMLSDLNYAPFPNLADAIPEFATLPANVVRFSRSRS